MDQSDLQDLLDPVGRGETEVKVVLLDLQDLQGSLDLLDQQDQVDLQGQEEKLDFLDHQVCM